MTTEEAPPKQVDHNNLTAVVDITSTDGEFKAGEKIPKSVPMHARKAWVRHGLAQ